MTIYRQLPNDMKDENVGRPKKQQQLGQPNLSCDKLGQTNKIIILIYLNTKNFYVI